MWKMTEEQVWHGVALGSAALAGVVARRALIAGWKAAKRREPPENPASPGVGWGEAVAWTAAVGLAIGVGRLVGRRAATEAWRYAVGRYPAGVR